MPKQQLDLPAFGASLQKVTVENRIVELGISPPNFPKVEEIGGHYHSGTQMNNREQRRLTGEVIGHKPDCGLPLPVGFLVDGSRDDALLKIRRHFCEQIGGNELSFPGQPSRPESAAYRKTVDGVHVNSGQLRKTAKQDKRFFKTLLFVFPS